MISKYMVLSIFLLYVSISCVSSYTIKTRAFGKPICNCMLNKLAHQESLLGFEYLDQSSYMAHDQVVLYGFHKLYKHLWNTHIDSMQKIYKYITKRGGYTVLHDQILRNKHHIHEQYKYHEIDKILNSFLKRERELNEYLLKTANCISSSNKTDEISCYNQFYNDEDGPSDLEPDIVDPMTASFLDDNLITEQVERIKYLSDLITRVESFDKHKSNTPHLHSINPIGIYLIDKELKS